MNVAIIGGGVMGEAILEAVLNKGLSTPQTISVSDINEVRLRHLEHEYGVTVTSDNRQAISGSDVVVLAVKPQNLAEVMAGLNGQLKSAQLALSIVTGAKINTLCLGLNQSHVIRAAPNTPAQIGEGISVWAASAKITEQQKEWASSILGAVGEHIYVDDERYIDMATAVSGSGPAYIFLMVEALIDSAVYIGLPHDMAQEMVLKTMLGSGQLLQKSGKLPAELRKMVTTPGGTVAEALLKLQEGGFSGLLMQAVVAAYNKAKRLGD